MKIGIDARLWNQTGVGRYVRNLIYELQLIDKQNNYVLFVRDEDYNDVKFRIQNSKFKIQKCNIRWHTIQEQIILPHTLNKYNLDLVHFPYYSVPVFYNKPFVVTIHDLIPLHFQTGKASTLPSPFYKVKFLAFKFIVSQAAKKAKKIITPSNFSKKDIVKSFKINSSKVEVVYEGVDKALINNVKKDEIGNYFLYIGNAYPHKNIEVLLEVFRELSDQKLILVGKEDYFYKRLKKKAEKSNLTNIKFFGYATDSQLLDLYKKAIALIIPSFMEGFGLPALEAMSNGCVVIASDIPTLREICSEAAIYFNPKDKDSLKNLIENVCSDTTLYRSKIVLGIKRSKEFDWRKTAKKTLHIYESCV